VACCKRVVRPGKLYGPRSKDFVLEIARQLKQGMMPVLNGGRACAGLLYVANGVEPCNVSKCLKQLGRSITCGWHGRDVARVSGKLADCLV